MSTHSASITIPIDLTNPGQFFACCGLLELADRLWLGTEGWFEGEHFLVIGPPECSLRSLLGKLAEATVDNTMTPTEKQRLENLSSMKKRERDAIPGLEDERKSLEALRRELPITLSGAIEFRVDWFCDEFGGGSRFKTWAGQQSVLDIAQAMHRGLTQAIDEFNSSLWGTIRGIGLPFNFDSDLGAQGSALDIGFSFDPLAGSETTRIEVSCRPVLELLCFIGLQRFRPERFRGKSASSTQPGTLHCRPPLPRPSRAARWRSAMDRYTSSSCFIGPSISRVSCQLSHFKETHDERTKRI